MKGDLLSEGCMVRAGTAKLLLWETRLYSPSPGPTGRTLVQLVPADLPSSVKKTVK